MTDRRSHGSSRHNAAHRPKPRESTFGEIKSAVKSFLNSGADDYPDEKDWRKDRPARRDSRDHSSQGSSSSENRSSSSSRRSRPTTSSSRSSKSSKSSMFSSLGEKAVSLAGDFALDVAVAATSFAVTSAAMDLLADNRKHAKSPMVAALVDEDKYRHRVRRHNVRNEDRDRGYGSADEGEHKRLEFKKRKEQDREDMKQMQRVTTPNPFSRSSSTLALADGDTGTRRQGPFRPPPEQPPVASQVSSRELVPLVKYTTVPMESLPEQAPRQLLHNAESRHGYPADTATNASRDTMPPRHSSPRFSREMRNEYLLAPRVPSPQRHSLRLSIKSREHEVSEAEPVYRPSPRRRSTVPWDEPHRERPQMHARTRSSPSRHSYRSRAYSTDRSDDDGGGARLDRSRSRSQRRKGESSHTRSRDERDEWETIAVRSDRDTQDRRSRRGDREKRDHQESTGQQEQREEREKRHEREKKDKRDSRSERGRSERRDREVETSTRSGRDTSRSKSDPAQVSSPGEGIVITEAAGDHSDESSTAMVHQRNLSNARISARPALLKAGYVEPDQPYRQKLLAGPEDRPLPLRSYTDPTSTVGSRAPSVVSLERVRPKQKSVSFNVESSFNLEDPRSSRASVTGIEDRSARPKLLEGATLDHRDREASPQSETDEKVERIRPGLVFCSFELSPTRRFEALSCLGLDDKGRLCGKSTTANLVMTEWWVNQHYHGDYTDRLSSELSKLSSKVKRYRSRFKDSQSDFKKDFRSDSEKEIRSRLKHERKSRRELEDKYEEDLKRKLDQRRSGFEQDLGSKFGLFRSRSSLVTPACRSCAKRHSESFFHYPSGEQSSRWINRPTIQDSSIP